MQVILDNYIIVQAIKCTVGRNKLISGSVVVVVIVFLFSHY